jgi:hypothetical protein
VGGDGPLGANTSRAVTFRRTLLGALLVCGILANAAPAVAATSPEATLAARYAPVVRLVAQKSECGSGEPYTPMSVDPVLGNDEVALRGPWSESNLVKVAPTAADVSAGLPGYHLDFPGNPLRPGCGFEEWQRRLTTVPTTYAHVVSESGQTSLQYWFFYVYNDYNDRHEGDWEMIQLDFPAATATAALETTPSEVGYAQHNGAERAVWGDPKLELVDGSHPVVYPAAGSHADYFGSALYLGRSAAQGVGCDNTRGPSRELRPAVELVPTDAALAVREYPWLGFQGFWGQEEPIYNNGPTGPNVHSQWDQPITWAQTRWHPTAFAIPGAINNVPSATSLFCSGVAAGSTALNLAIDAGTTAILLLLVGIVALVVAVVRADWQPSQPRELARRRGIAQILAASRNMYHLHPWAFLAVGALFVPVSLLTALIQKLLFAVAGLDALEQVVGTSNPAVSGLAMTIAVVIALVALTFVQAIVASAVSRKDDLRGLGPKAARDALRPRLPALLAALALVAAVVTLLTLVVVGIPVAVWLLVRWSLFAQCVVLEDLSWRDALTRSRALVHGHWWRTATTLAVAVGVALLLGPTIGLGVLLVTPIDLTLVNLIAGVVYTLTIPYAAIATTYLYYDLRVRSVVERSPAVLPAEAVLD